MTKADKAYQLLEIEYPNAKCSLDYGTPFQLLVSTILSAQATDKSVNNVTEKLYKLYPDVDSFLTLTQEEIENKIKKIGLYKNKSKNIYNMCRELRDKFNKEVPKTMVELMSLSGVGRKTASVVLVEAFKIPAFPVDTHVFRVSRRLGLAKGSTADKVSDEMMKKLSKKKWHLMHHLLITHGREVCIAQNPKCEICCLKNICTYFKAK
ncbi:endonuclease-3 [Sedimentibacter acidaminivorans]|uniref:Endonuclease III n=1 Tax=Sedimentibacter acidaminivorans TaxID=913099 RepID=A0ABS4GCZ6_9FIRM|nr:endonuclease III [Sedimentibacter acidaminivorans]MBP1925551.1 endonuclease-3 [Sedimentibacter acidaminivorans]